MDPMTVHVGLPLEEPKPSPGCGVCQALARQRGEAARNGNHSRVTDLNVEMRDHHTAHGA
ncbi:hypothetical protein ACWC10_08335 [Streptomyces sp. NPDC001595]